MRSLEPSRPDILALTGRCACPYDSAMYFVPIATPASTTAYGQDKELAEQLWKLSEDIVAQA